MGKILLYSLSSTPFETISIEWLFTVKKRTMQIRNPLSHKTFAAVSNAALLIGLLIAFSSLRTPQQTASSKPASSFRIDLRHFWGTEGETLYWHISQDSISVKYTCDWRAGWDTTLYRAALDSTTSATYLTAVWRLHLEKLQPVYEKKSLRDGLYVYLFLENVCDRPVKVNLHGIRNSHVDDFYRLTDSLLLGASRYKTAGGLY